MPRFLDVLERAFSADLDKNKDGIISTEELANCFCDVSDDTLHRLVDTLSTSREQIIPEAASIVFGVCADGQDTMNADLFKV